MDKQCLIKSTKEAIRATIIAILVLLIFNGIFKEYTLPILLSFSLIYGMGAHLGFCMGFNYKIIPFSVPLILVIAVNFLFIFIPLLIKQEFDYGLNMAIFFNMAYIAKSKPGKTFYNKLYGDKNTDSNNTNN